MHIVILDLEHNQPSKSIIQIGAVKCDLRSNKVIETFNCFCKLPDGEVLDPFIQKLCNISPELLETDGIPIDEALVKFWKFTKFCGGRVYAWGKDVFDIRECSKFYEVSYPRLSPLDLMKVYKLFSLPISNKKKAKGLIGALQTYDMEFLGTHHNALDDALNTARLVFQWTSQIFTFHKIKETIREYEK